MVALLATETFRGHRLHKWRGQLLIQRKQKLHALAIVLERLLSVATIHGTVESLMGLQQHAGQVSGSYRTASVCPASRKGWRASRTAWAHSSTLAFCAPVASSGQGKLL